MLYIGEVQEKARVVRTERRQDSATGDTYPWLVDWTAMVNEYYVYAVDDDFGEILRLNEDGTASEDNRFVGDTGYGREIYWRSATAWG